MSNPEFESRQIDPPQLFAEGELDGVKDDNFRQFLNLLGTNAVPSEVEGYYNFTETAKNMVDYFRPSFGTESDYYIVNRLVDTSRTFKREVFIEGKIRGTRGTRHEIFCKNDLLFTLGYSYYQKEYKQKRHMMPPSIPVALEETSKLWGEHPMASHIKSLNDISKNERRERFGKEPVVDKKRPYSGRGDNATEGDNPNKLSPEERAKLLESVDINMLYTFRARIMSAISKSPTSAYRTNADWVSLDIHEVIGEVIEFVRRTNLDIESALALNDVTLENARDGVDVTIGYVEKYHEHISHLGELEASIKRAIDKSK